MRSGGGRFVGAALLAAAAAVAIAAPFLAPGGAGAQYTQLLNAPPTRIHVHRDDGRWSTPYICRWRLVSRLEQRYEEDRAASAPLVWFANRRLVSSADPSVPLLLLGTDAFGRDVFGRLVYGARVSLGLALVAALGAALAGALIGGVAGYTGGWLDNVLMRVAEFILLLPAIYVALALRAALPLVLSARDVFLLLAGIFMILGAPFVARGVRSIVAAERRLDYAAAAASLGATDVRILFRHLLPASAGFIGVQLTILIPAFIVAEATLSYVGLGFPDSVASWGVMLQDASNVAAAAQFPWLLSPAAAIFAVVLGVNLVVQSGGHGGHPVRATAGETRGDTFAALRG